MSAAAIEERCGLVEATLSTSQLTQPGEAIGRHSGSTHRELVACARQLAFGFIPCAAPHADRRVLRAADREQRLQPPSSTVFLDPVAPLHGTTVIARAIAGPDQ